MTASYPHNLNAIYAKYAKEAAPALRPAPAKADSGKNQSWLDSLTRALAGNALISGGLLLPKRLRLPDRIMSSMEKDYIRGLSANFPEWLTDSLLTEKGIKHTIKYIPKPSEHAAILKQQKRLLRRARRLEPKIDFVPPSETIVWPVYDQSSNSINMTTTRPETLAHEMGHARNDKTMRRLLGDKWTRRYGLHTHAYDTPLIAARIAAPLMLGSDNENVRAAAPWVLAASGIPKLTGNTLASLRGMRNYYRRLGGRRPLSGAKTLAQPLISYTISTAMPALTAYLANKMNNAALASDNKKLRNVYQGLALTGGTAALYRNTENELARLKYIQRTLPRDWPVTAGRRAAPRQ